METKYDRPRLLSELPDPLLYKAPFILAGICFAINYEVTFGNSSKIISVAIRVPSLRHVTKMDATELLNGCKVAILTYTFVVTNPYETVTSTDRTYEMAWNGGATAQMRKWKQNTRPCTFVKYYDALAKHQRVSDTVAICYEIYEILTHIIIMPILFNDIANY